MRKFYVTLDNDVRIYIGADHCEEVNADDVNVGPAGELAFCNDVGDNDRHVSVVFAPGTWVLFTEMTEK